MESYTGLTETLRDIVFNEGPRAGYDFFYANVRVAAELTGKEIREYLEKFSDVNTAFEMIELDKMISEEIFPREKYQD